MANINEQLDNVRALLKDNDFLEGKGLANEVNIRIFCYDPKDEMAVRYFTEQIRTDQSLDCHVREHNLYQIFLRLCDEMGMLDEVPEIEKDEGSEFVLSELRNAITVNDYVNVITEVPVEKGDVLLITGVGEAYPFIRVHGLLSAIQKRMKDDIPIVVFYPGAWDGHYLKLFDKLDPNPYYRAFKVV